MRATSLLLGGLAGFLGIIDAVFSGLINSLFGDGFPLAMAACALVGLVGATLAKHRPRASAVLESIAGVGLLADGHPILGGPLLVASALCLISLKTSPLPDRAEKPIRADAASAFTVVGVAGLAIVAGLGLPILGLVILGAALSGGSAGGGGGVVEGLTLTVAVSALLGLALLAYRAARRAGGDRGSRRSGGVEGRR